MPLRLDIVKNKPIVFYILKFILQKRGRIMYKKLSILVLSCIAVNAIAGGSVNSTVKKIRSDASGQTMIYFEADISVSGANCRGDSYKNVFAVDTNTDGGKTVLSIALAAKMSSSPVEATGKMNCDVYGNGVAETIDHIVIK